MSMKDPTVTNKTTNSILPLKLSKKAHSAIDSNLESIDVESAADHDPGSKVSAHVHRTAAQTRPLSANRPFIFVGLLGVALGFVLRWWFLSRPQSYVSADEAITGIMANDIVRGNLPVVVAKNAYGGTIEAFLFAPFSNLTKSGVPLKVSAVIVWFFACLTIGLVGRHLGGNPGLYAGIVAWIFSGAIVRLSTQNYLGYPSGVLSLSLAMLLAARMRTQMNKTPPAALILGFVSGLCVWLHPMFVSALIPLLLITGWAVAARNIRWWSSLGFGGLIALLPFLVWNAANSWPSLSSAPPPAPSTYLKRLENFFTDLAPRSFGTRLPNGEWLGASKGKFAFYAISAAFLIGLVSVLLRLCVQTNRPSARIIACSALFTPLLMAVFPPLIYDDDSRYIVNMFPVLCLFVVAGIAFPVYVVRRIVLRFGRQANTGSPTVSRFATHASAIFLGLGLIGWALVCVRYIHLDGRGATDQERAANLIVRELDAAKVEGIFGGYWGTYPIVFRMHERIPARIISGPDRFPRLARAADKAPSNKRAYLFAFYEENASLLPKDQTWKRIEAAPFVLYVVV